MAIKLINPLAMNVPIVDEKGNPTPYFIRVLQEISNAKVAASVIDAMGGDPGADMIVAWDDSTDNLTFMTISEVLDFITGASHGDILFRGSTGWETLNPGTAGQLLQTNGAGADPEWATIAAAGATWTLTGGAYTTPGIWDQGADGSVSEVVFTGLDGCTDILIIMDAVTKSVSGTPWVRVSDDNGATWETSYGYQSTAGVRTTNSIFCEMHLSGATAARDAIFEIHAANGPRAVAIAVTANVNHRIFIGQTAPINAVRIFPSAGGNFTGGKFYCLTR